MKKIILGSAVAAVLASSPALAMDNTVDVASMVKDNSYAGASVGISDMGLADDAVIVTGRYGMGLGDLIPAVPNLAAEVEATMTVSDASTEYFGGSYDASYFGLSTYAVYNYDLGERVNVEGLTVFGRAGVGYTNYDYEYIDDTDIDVAVGVGAKYDLSAVAGVENLSVRAEFTDQGVYDEFKAGVDYAF